MASTQKAAGLFTTMKERVGIKSAGNLFWKFWLSAPVGYAVAAVTPKDQPPEGINPLLHTGLGAFSAAAAAYGYYRKAWFMVAGPSHQ
eukprot:jgi/Botrbrau1/13338/Bobra.0334s0014.1